MLKNFYKDKTIFLTGHTGFKGSWLLLMLKNLGAKVYCYSLPPEDVRGNMFNLLHLDKICEESTFGDIRDKNSFEKALLKANPDIIFHLAAQPFVLRSYKNPLETIESNVIGTTNLFEIVRQNKTKTQVIVNITSDKSYENKEWIWPYRENDAFGGYDPYSASKGMCEILTSCYQRSFFNEMNIALASCRAGNVVGGGDFGEDRIIPDLIENIAKNSVLQIRSPNAVRPWQHVLDVLYGYLLTGYFAFNDKKKYATGYNLAPLQERDITVAELVENLIEKIGKGEFKIIENQNKHEAHFLRLDSTKARNELQWKNILDFDAICKYTADWYKVYLEKGDIIKFTNQQIENYFANIIKDKDIEPIK